MFKTFVKIVILATLITLIGACKPVALQATASTTSPPVSTTQTPSSPPDTNTPMTAERLIEECAEAMGGLERIGALHTLRFTQRFPDHSGLIHNEIKRPNLIRMGDNLVFDGERASWLEGKNPGGALLVPEEEWKDFEVDIAWYVPAFFDYPAEYLGTETLDNIETHKLQVTLPLGAIMTYHLDAQTYLVYKATAYIIIDDTVIQPERVYSDYQLNDGILYPHAFTYQGRDGVFTATMVELEFNVPLEDKRFSVPKAAYDVLPTGTNIPVQGAISIGTVDQVEILYTLSGHGDRVVALAISRDSAYVASSSLDKTIKLWDLQSGQEMHTFGINEVDINSIAFSPDGRLLASPDIIWDVESGQVVHTLERGRNVPASVAFSPDGSLLAVAFVNQAIKLWNVANGQLVRTFDRQNDNEMCSLAFSPDGTLLAASGLHGWVGLWEVATGQIVAVLEYGDETHVHDVAFSSDGSILASGGTDHAVRLWDLTSGQVLHTLRTRDGPYSVAFSPDGSLLASAGLTVDLWDVASASLVHALPHGGMLMAVAFSPDGTLLASGGYDNKVDIWGVP